MAATEEVLDMAAQIFDQAGLALDESYVERVRQLGDASCKAGIEATIRYLSEKSELSDDEFEMLSAGNIPVHLRERDFEAHIKRLNETTDPELGEKDRGLCEDAFASGLSAAIFHLIKAADSRQVDLLSLIPSNGS